ncbi:hypothetical protein [Streptomyces sp. NBC_01803]|uniref:hypothetical protein n=1 Tax=Streptomyces sp. NBC_01803 TaxID=2975946 RepID=UPI002DD9A6F7|nr:hypothetical protein [Streptomyces sp. NBC_01803]WSA47751.1 hypothetical protein OIE51_23520 [Streptomyces sp. NBC_01803]
MSLPAADELFRSTGGAAVQPSTPSEPAPEDSAARVPAPAGEQTPPSGEESESAPRSRSPEETRRARLQHATERMTREAPVPAQPRREPAPPAGGKNAAPASAPATPRKNRAARRPSGRERHDEKITVYVSAEELMDLEHARLVLRGEHGLAVDRGRIVREAVAVVLADLESRGDASILVRRLRGR